MDYPLSASPHALRRLVIVLGVPIDDLDLSETLDRLEAMILSGRAHGKGHQIVTVNADFAVKGLRDPQLRALLQNADLATADGMPLVWGARLLGVRLRGRVAGADLVPQLAERAARQGYSIYLLGAAPGVAEQAAEILCERYPGLNIAGIQAPHLRSIEDTDPALLQDIRLARPDVLMVAFGNPKQEKWIGRFGPQLNVPVMMGIGGSLDFIAQRTRRAPRWMQQAGLEWLHRLLQEPRRLWQRYAVDLVVFSSSFMRQMWAMRRGWMPFLRRPAPQPDLPLVPTSGSLLIDDTAILNIPTQLTVENLDPFRAEVQDALASSKHVIANLAQTIFLDSSAVGALVDLTRRARAAGGEVWLANPQPEVQNTLRLLKLDAFFQITADVDTALLARQGLANLHKVALAHAAPHNTKSQSI